MPGPSALAHVLQLKGSAGPIEVFATLVVLFSATYASAQGTSPGIETNPARKLLPIGKIILQAAVEREDKATNAGIRTSISFPLPMCGFTGGLCGAVNRDGTIAVAPEFDWVDAFHEDRALVRQTGLYGYVDTAGRLIAKPQYRIAGTFFRGYAQVDVEGTSGLIDREGRTVLEPRYGFVAPFTTDVFWASEDRSISDGVTGTEQFAGDGLSFTVVFQGVPDKKLISGGKFGLVDRTASWIRRPDVLAIRPFDPVHRAVMWAKADAGWGLIRPDGTWFVMPTFQDAHQLVDGLAPVKRGGKWGYVDRNGVLTIEPQFDLAGYFEVGRSLAPARVGKLFGLIDRSGSWVVEPKFDEIFARSAWFYSRRSIPPGGRLGLAISAAYSRSARGLWQGRCLTNRQPFAQTGGLPASSIERRTGLPGTARLCCPWWASYGGFLHATHRTSSKSAMPSAMSTRRCGR